MYINRPVVASLALGAAVTNRPNLEARDAAATDMATVTQVVESTTTVILDVVVATESPEVTVTPATVTDVVTADESSVDVITKTTMTANKPKTTVIIHHLANLIASKAVSQMAPLPKSSDVCQDQKDQHDDENNSDRSDDSNCTALAAGDNWQFVPCDSTCSHNLAKIIPGVIVPTGVGAGLWPTIHRLRKYWKTEDGSRIQQQLLDSWDRYIKNRFSDMVLWDHEASMGRVLKSMKLKMKTPQIPELEELPLPDSPPGVDSPDGGIPTPKDSPTSTEAEAEWMEPYVYDEILRGRVPVPEAIVPELSKYLDDRGFEIEEELDPLERAKDMAWANDAYESITKACTGPKLCDFWKKSGNERNSLTIAQDSVKIARFNLEIAEQRTDSTDVSHYEQLLELTIENLKRVEEEYKKKPAEPVPSPAPGPAPEPEPVPAPAPGQDSPEVKDAKDYVETARQNLEIVEQGIKDEAIVNKFKDLLKDAKKNLKKVEKEDKKKQAEESHKFQTISLETASASTGSTEYSRTSHSSSQYTTTSATTTTVSTTTSTTPTTMSTATTTTVSTTTSATPTTMSTVTKPASKSEAWTGVPTASPTGVSGYVDFDHNNFIIYGKGYAKTPKQAEDLFKKLNRCSKIDGWQFVSGDAITGIEKERGWDFYATGQVKHENDECIAKAIKAAHGPKVEWGVNGMDDDHPTDGHLFGMEMEMED